MSIRLLLAWAVIALALSTACGGDDSSGGTCTRAPVPATGPGDALGYFPVEVGRTWTYSNQSGTTLLPETTTISVSGTEVVDGETVYLFTSSNPDDGTELVAKRAAGVYALADPSVEPPLDQMYPSLLLPFPVAPATRQQLVRCSDIDLGDLDEDGEVDRGDIQAGLTVYSVTEPATVIAGSFTTAHVYTDVTMTVRASSVGTVMLDGIEDDWYAPGVGLVLSLFQVTSGATQLAHETHALISYTVPGAETLPPSAGARSAAVAPGATPRGSSVEEAALRILRQFASPR